MGCLCARSRSDESDEDSLPGGVEWATTNRRYEEAVLDSAILRVVLRGPTGVSMREIAALVVGTANADEVPDSIRQAIARLADRGHVRVVGRVVRPPTHIRDWPADEADPPSGR
jgi:hypothetical protein